MLDLLSRLGINTGRKNQYYAVSGIPSEAMVDAILVFYRAEIAALLNAA